MNRLLDSHAFIWLRQEPDRIGTAAMDALQVPGNDIMLSAATLWELQIKIDLGKFSFGARSSMP